MAGPDACPATPVPGPVLCISACTSPSYLHPDPTSRPVVVEQAIELPQRGSNNNREKKKNLLSSWEKTRRRTQRGGQPAWAEGFQSKVRQVKKVQGTGTPTRNLRTGTNRCRTGYQPIRMDWDSSCVQRAAACSLSLSATVSLTVSHALRPFYTLYIFWSTGVWWARFWRCAQCTWAAWWRC